jgi:hypothetical protein
LESFEEGDAPGAPINNPVKDYRRGRPILLPTRYEEMMSFVAAERGGAEDEDVVVVTLPTRRCSLECADGLIVEGECEVGVATGDISR